MIVNIYKIFRMHSTKYNKENAIRKMQNASLFIAYLAIFDIHIRLF